MTGTRYARIFDSHGRLTQNCEAAVREVFRRFDEVREVSARLHMCSSFKFHKISLRLAFSPR